MNAAVTTPCEGTVATYVNACAVLVVLNGRVPVMDARVSVGVLPTGLKTTATATQLLRLPMPKKPDQSVRWSKREKALLYHHETCKPTSMLIAHLFEGVLMKDIYGGVSVHDNDHLTFAQELERRGYDLTTLKFSIDKKKP